MSPAAGRLRAYFDIRFRGLKTTAKIRRRYATEASSSFTRRLRFLAWVIVCRGRTQADLATNEHECHNFGGGAARRKSDRTERLSLSAHRSGIARITVN